MLTKQRGPGEATLVCPEPGATRAGEDFHYALRTLDITFVA
jgi:hypothetical protein